MSILITVDAGATYSRVSASEVALDPSSYTLLAFDSDSSRVYVGTDRGLFRVRIHDPETVVRDATPLGSLFLSLYPNPARDRLAIAGIRSGPVRVEIYDQLGRMMVGRTGAFPASTGPFIVDLPPLAPGVYKCTIVTGSERFGSSFVVVQ